MKQQVVEDVNIMSQLNKASDPDKDKIVGFISWKDGRNFILLSLVFW